jgi:hypothetical protein
VAPLFPLTTKDRAHLPDARARVTLALRDWRAQCQAWLASELVGLLRLDSALRRGFRLVTIIGCLSTPVWVLGDRWLVGKGQHVLDDDCLHLRVSPLDKPNTVLILHSNSPVRLTHMGLEQSGVACVFLYLDSPQALASALHHPPRMKTHT